MNKQFVNKGNVTVYLDLTGIISSRINTGIQRVVKEFLQRTLLSSDQYSSNKDINYCYLEYKQIEKKYYCISAQEIHKFLNNINDYQFVDKQAINLFEDQIDKTAIFFDMDSVWNFHPRRMFLYPKLKKNNYVIINYIYDLSPVLLPQFSHENTCRNFITFLSSVYHNSDMVYFDSASAEQDFLNIKKELDVTRIIPTRVTGLGSDFTQKIRKVEPKKKIKLLLDKKYLLFVGTIEPRKEQEIVLNAFETLAKKYSDLNLIFIGKQGWRIENFLDRINKHPLKEKQFYYLNEIDDDTLSCFYKNAWLVIYLSKHEGYGLPIAESLRYHNITIASKNSSMFEVGRNFSDYIVYNSKNEIIDTISLYYDNSDLYKEKKEWIKKGFKAVTWDEISLSIIDTFTKFPKAIEFKHKQKNNTFKKLQFIFISIDLDNIKGSISSVDYHINFVKEYIIITSPELVDGFRTIKTKHKLTIIDETTLLKEYAADFPQRDHQSKNWLLRASLLNLSFLDEEFIMLDDDNRPIKKISIDYFISKEGHYNAYYFYDLLNWHSSCSSYDKGQHNTQKILSDKNYELLSYSSHAPQIVNKTIFSQVIEEFFDIGLKTSIDEWSIYFNYAISKYPYLFHKKIFQTLNWPALPTDWIYQYEPESYSFENYYSDSYIKEGENLDGLKYFKENYSIEKKLQVKEQQYLPHRMTNMVFLQYQHELARQNKIMGCLKFETEALNCYLFSVPMHVITMTSSQFRLVMNCKVINKTQQRQKIDIYYLINGESRHSIPVDISDVSYYDSIIELPILTHGLRCKTYNIQLDIKINDKALYAECSPYKIKLSNYHNSSQIKLSKIMNKKMLNNIVLSDTIKRNPQRIIKDFIIEIPLFGSMVRKIHRWLFSNIRKFKNNR